jgi:hypothetical protein
MKKTIIFLIIFFTLALCLYAQETATRETRIYVPPLDGTGYIDDMAYFYKQITGEITDQHRTLGRTRRSSDYVITGTVMPTSEVNDILPYGSENDTNILFVELFDNALNESVSNQFITYNYPDEPTNEMLSIVIYNMLSVIPDSMEGAYGEWDAWRNKRLYLNVNFLYSPRGYRTQTSPQAGNLLSIGGEFMVDYHITSFLAVKAAGEITQDAVPFTTIDYDTITSFTLAPAFVTRPGENFMLEYYTGASLNFSFFPERTTIPSLVSWIIGVQLGVRTGFGIVTFDPRFGMDLGWSQSQKYGQFRRWTVHLGVGFKMGFFDRK